MARSPCTTGAHVDPENAMPVTALNPASFRRWSLRDIIVQCRLAQRSAS